MREALSLDRLRAMAPDEAAAHVVAHGFGELTADERAIVSAWLGESEEHREALDRAERAWNSFSAADDDDDLLAAMRVHALRPRASRWFGLSRFAAVAALLIVTISVTLLLISGARWWQPGPGSEVPPPMEYASARGEVKRVQLPDGSTMTLDAESMAAVRFSGFERLIELKRGRAFFEAVSDPARPFSVVAEERRVLALGTRFEVDLAGAFTVTLVEGRVTVGPTSGSGRPVALEPGQQLVERNGIRMIRRLGERAEMVGEWRGGLLNFEDMELRDAILEVNRYSPDRIVISDRRVAEMRISGQFRAGDADRFAQTVAEIHPVRPVRRGNEIELLPAR